MAGTDWIDFFIKRDATYPPLQATLKDSNDVALDLTSAAATFCMMTEDRTSTVVNATCVVVSTAGTVRYDWATADTDVAGIYLGEFRGELSDGTRFNCPSDTHIKISIVSDIA